MPLFLLLELLGLFSLIFFIGTLLGVPVLINRTDQEYFRRLKKRRIPLKTNRPRSNIIIYIVRNLVGLIVVLVGIAMLVLPGQGVLTILLGLCIMDFPGKRTMILSLVRRKRIRDALNWIRRKGGRSEFLFDEEGPA